ncbi:MAG: winged helix-turn-helix transcriptional regulator [bacterium]|nr:winged helix-turn-helix transcriptional regulator [bacterium]
MIPSELQDKLGFNINRVGLLFRRELTRALAAYKMTPEQWQIMMTLWSTGEPVSQKDIVEMTLKDKHTVSRIIQRLERDGWIEKLPGTDDARVTFIHSTQKSLSMQDEMKPIMSSHFKKIWKDFEKEEKEMLLGTLKKLRIILGDE